MDTSQTVATEYVAASTEKEIQLVQIFATLLNKEVDAISVYDNFFDLGANSLKMINAAAQIRETLHIELNTVILFKYPNIKALSEYIFDTFDEQLVAVDDIDTSEYLDDSFDLF